MRADALPYPADQTRASYLAEIARAVLVQCDSGRSAAVKRALESLRILTLHTHKEMGSSCLQGIVKYANWLRVFAVYPFAVRLVIGC